LDTKSTLKKEKERIRKKEKSLSGRPFAKTRVVGAQSSWEKIKKIQQQASNKLDNGSRMM
jgi:hypothetical protein